MHTDLDGRLVSTYVCIQRQANQKSIPSYRNLCDIQCSCEIPPWRIFIWNLPRVLSKNVANRLLTS